MLNPDTLIERSKLRAAVSKWRVVAFLSIIIALLISFVSTKDFKNEHEPFIARISIDNIILEDQDRIDIIKQISKNDKVKAVIVDINSPGGTAVGGETLYGALKELSAKKPTVTVMKSMATSAGYMIALGTERIYAHNGTITGSIGVLMQIPNVKESLDKLGVRFDYVKSSPLKGSPDPFEPKNEQALAVVKEMMMDFYDYFVALVARERKLQPEVAKSLADGRIFSGKAALENRLVDGLGGEKEALAWLQDNKKIDKKLKIKEVKLEKPKKPFEEFLGTISEKLNFDAVFNGNLLFKGLLL